MTSQSENKGQEDKAQEQNLDLRRILSNAYASLEAEKTTNSFNAYTFEEAMDAQIERIEGKGTPIRPNELDRISKIESELVQAVEKIKAMPPEMFNEKDEAQDVNTSEDQTGV